MPGPLPPPQHNSHNGSLITQWSTAIARIGIPGAIAIWVVYLGSQEVPKLVRQIDLLYQEVVTSRELLREHVRQEEAQTRVLRWICAEITKNDQKCFE